MEGFKVDIDVGFCIQFWPGPGARYFKMAGVKVLRILLQLLHLVLAASVFLVGLVEFSVEPPIFDVFGNNLEQRVLIPVTVFNVS